MVLAALLTSGKIRCDIMKFPLVTLKAFLSPRVVALNQQHIAVFI